MGHRRVLGWSCSRASRRPQGWRVRNSRSERITTVFTPLYFFPILLLVAFVVITLISASVKILRQYERAVVFTLGRFHGVKRPVIQVQRYLPATVMLAQTTLRAVLGQHELDEMLSERKKLSTDVQSILDTQTETWGIKVSNVEIRTVELTENMVRAIAKQAEAERDRRAKIIHAEAEFQASQTLVNAAQILSTIPAAMQLRYLQTLTEIGAEQNSTVVFPMPIDIVRPFLELLEKAGKPASANGAARVPLMKDVQLAASGTNG